MRDLPVEAKITQIISCDQSACERFLPFDSLRSLRAGSQYGGCAAVKWMQRHVAARNDSAVVAAAVSQRHGIRSAARDGGHYNFVRPESACCNVSSSADSKPAPAGKPRAMRVSATGLSLKRSTR